MGRDVVKFGSGIERLNLVEELEQGARTPSLLRVLLLIVSDFSSFFKFRNFIISGLQVNREIKYNISTKSTATFRKVHQLLLRFTTTRPPRVRVGLGRYWFRGRVRVRVRARVRVRFKVVLRNVVVLKRENQRWKECLSLRILILI